jgi:hypothetical protein
MSPRRTRLRMCGELFSCFCAVCNSSKIMAHISISILQILKKVERMVVRRDVKSDYAFYQE